MRTCWVTRVLRRVRSSCLLFFLAALGTTGGSGGGADRPSSGAMPGTGEGEEELPCAVFPWEKVRVGDIAFDGDLTGKDLVERLVGAANVGQSRITFQVS